MRERGRGREREWESEGEEEKKTKTNPTYARARRSAGALLARRVFIRSDNICWELGRPWAGGAGRVVAAGGGKGSSAAFEVDARIRVAKRHSCVETLGGSKGRERKRAGECPTSRDDPATGSPATFCRRMLPFLTSGAACAIWPRVRFGGHTLGIQKFGRALPTPSPRLKQGRGAELPAIPLDLFLL